MRFPSPQQHPSTNADVAPQQRAANPSTVRKCVMHGASNIRALRLQCARNCPAWAVVNAPNRKAEATPAAPALRIIADLHVIARFETLAFLNFINRGLRHVYCVGLLFVVC